MHIRTILCCAALVPFISACGNTSKSSGARPVVASIPAPVGQPSVRTAGASPAAESAAAPRAAVETFLNRLMSSDADGSYALLSNAERSAISAAGWAASFSSLPTYERFDIVRDEPVEVDATFAPRLDEDAGLVPRRALVHFATVAEDGGWRVSLNKTVIDPHYLSDEASAVAAALLWAQGEQACSGAKNAMQYEGSLLGQPSVAKDLCHWNGTLATVGVVKLATSRSATPVRNAFGPTADEWARVVRIDGSTPFDVVIGPLGDTWRVVAVSRP